MLSDFYLRSLMGGVVFVVSSEIGSGGLVVKNEEEPKERRVIV